MPDDSRANHRPGPSRLFKLETAATREDPLHKDLSAVVRVGDSLFLACYETARRALRHEGRKVWRASAFRLSTGSSTCRQVPKARWISKACAPATDFSGSLDRIL